MGVGLAGSGPRPRRRAALAAVLAALALAVAGCGGMDPVDVPGQDAPQLETQLEGLAVPRGAERVRVITDNAGRSIAHYLVSDAEVAEVAEFHVEALTSGGWEESRRSTSESDGEPVARLRFGRGAFERAGVESLRYRLTVDLVQDGDDVLMVWSVLDQQNVDVRDPE